MKKNQIIAIAGVVVVLIVGAVIIGMSSSDDKNSSTKNSSSSSSNSNSADDKFNAIATTNTSFIATITTKIDNKSYTSTMESDAKTGSVKYVSNAEGEKMTFIYTKDAYFMCVSEANCFKYNLGEGSGASFDPSKYQYDSNKLNEYKNSSTYTGKRSCKAGTCDVWKTNYGGFDGEVLVDQKTKRVSEVVSNSAEGMSTIVYEYKDVKIEIPTNIQEVPTGFPLPQ